VLRIVAVSGGVGARQGGSRCGGTGMNVGRCCCCCCVHVASLLLMNALVRAPKYPSHQGARHTVSMKGYLPWCSIAFADRSDRYALLLRVVPTALGRRDHHPSSTVVGGAYSTFGENRTCVPCCSCPCSSASNSCGYSCCSCS
jgi:hypothetical protein